MHAGLSKGSPTQPVAAVLALEGANPSRLLTEANGRWAAPEHPRNCSGLTLRDGKGDPP